MNTNTTTCFDGTLEHPRYYARQLMTPVEMNLEHTYWRDKLRRHNRFLHGWGVVCGAEVIQVSTGHDDERLRVKIMPGYILAPSGDEIVIAREHIVDLEQLMAPATAQDPFSALPDPWCSDVPCELREGENILCIKYVEIPSRPVKTPSGGCGCNDSQCEYSRYCDGYEICILDKCELGDPPTSIEEALKLQAEACPDCSKQRCVPLASIYIQDGGIKEIDWCGCRRYVASFATYWWQCTPQNKGYVPSHTVEPETLSEDVKPVHDVPYVVRPRRPSRPPSKRALKHGRRGNRES